MISDSPRWNRLKKLFFDARDLSPSDRVAFLDGACADDEELRREAEALLASYDKDDTDDDFLLEPTSITDGTRGGGMPGLPGGSEPPTFRRSDLIGQKLSHYVLTRVLGAGGMGEVYLADDLALARPAAIKVVPEGFAPSVRRRLVLEAQMAARLQHPGIATFYETGESANGTFIAMEYVKGKTLRERLSAGPLSKPEVLSMVGFLLEALAHAHAGGLIHRDIKPENIMLAKDGRAKLLDFGLVKELADETKTHLSEELQQPSTKLDLTGVGRVAGTVGYMSPEQLRGGVLDARSDLFAVGAVLFEALIGSPAFPGSNAIERIAATLAEETPSLAAREQLGIAPELIHIVKKSLARAPGERYASASEFLGDIRRVSAGEALGPVSNALAVVDFANLSGKPDDNWIGSGIAESLGVDLAGIEGLSLVARDRVLGAKALLESPTPNAFLQLGLTLGCRWVLGGSFQRTGERIRVTSNLADVPTGEILWRDKTDGSVESLFDIQDRLANAVVEALQLKALDESHKKSAMPKLDAYECYARGRRLWLRLEKGAFDDATALYEQATRIDPDFALAHAGLAAVHAMRFTFTTDPSEIDKVLRHANRAIELDRTLGEPHVWLAYAHLRQHRLEDCYDESMRVIELNPTNEFGPYFAACARCADGRFMEAQPLFQKSLAIKARFAFPWLGLGWTHLELGRGDEACWSLGKAAELEREGAPGPTAGASGYLGECLRRLGKLDEARVSCLKGLEAVEKTDHMYRDTFRGVCLTALGRVALGQDDPIAAHAAFEQARSLFHGRSRALGGGHLVVQALAGIAQAGQDDARPSLEKALDLFERRERFDFSWLWACTNDIALLELARGAARVGRRELACELVERARDAGSAEARSNPGI